jgi:rhodanese-related sulfurtransferase
MSSACRKDALFDQFAQVAKAMASPKRIELLDVISQGERSVEALAQATGLKFTTASAHLQSLRHGGLVATRKQGTHIYYRLAGDDIARLYVCLRDVAVRHLAETQRAARDFLGEDELEAVDREELLARVNSGRVILVDVRPAEEFAAGHIKGAVSIPLDEVYDWVHELPPGSEVVAYCRGEYCVLAYDAVRILRRQGLAARRMKGGMLEWMVEGRPTAVQSA